MIRLGQGRWALSPIIREVHPWAGAVQFTTEAERQVKVAGRRVENYFPPMLEDGSGYHGTHALVRVVDLRGAFVADTTLLPMIALGDRIGSLALAERNALAAALDSSLLPFEFRDYDGVRRTKPAFRSSRFNADATMHEVLLAVLDHFHHSEARPRAARFDPHNTEYLDDFSTDPAARWTVESQNYAWDSTNGEMDVTYSGGWTLIRYSANSPGYEHECQVMSIGDNNRGVGPAVRVFNDGTNHCYHLDTTAADGAGDATISLVRSGALVLASEVASGISPVAAQFWKTRLAAAGAVGANVTLDCWYGTPTFVGSGKPPDTGWVGADGTPDFSYTDTSVDRHDDAACDQCGISGRTPGAEYDTRTDYWKTRAISDRTGINLFWRCEDEILDPLLDHTTGANTFEIAGPGITIGSAAGMFGTNGIVVNDDETWVHMLGAGIANPVEGAAGFSFRYSAWQASTSIFILQGSDFTDRIEIITLGTDELRFTIDSNSGGGPWNLDTTAANLASGTRYGILIRWNDATNSRRIEIYNDDGSLRHAVEDTSTAFSAPVELNADIVLGGFAFIGGAFAAHFDNLFIADAYDAIIEDNFGIESFADYGEADEEEPPAPPTLWLPGRSNIRLR